MLYLLYAWNNGLNIKRNEYCSRQCKVQVSVYINVRVYTIHVYDKFYNFIISGVPSYHEFYGDKKMSRFSKVQNIEEKWLKLVSLDFGIREWCLRYQTITL